MHSFSNASIGHCPQRKSHREGGFQMMAPFSPVGSPAQHNLPRISMLAAADSSQKERISSRPFQLPEKPSKRHTLSFSSPARHRTQVFGMLNPPVDTTDSHASVVKTQTYATEPVELDLHPPTPSAGSAPTTNFLTPSSVAPTLSPSVVDSGPKYFDVVLSESGRAYSIDSSSPQKQAISTASSQSETSSQNGLYVSMSDGAPVSGSHHQPVHANPDYSMAPMAPLGPASIQIMTIKSQSGHSVQVPVDIQVASRVANEKRKRNAGASARFRARRKEKEREASQSIARMEQRLRDAREDAQHYRTERDFFKSIVHQQQPDSEKLYARPPSPRLGISRQAHGTVLH